MRKLLVAGCSGHAALVVDAAEKSGDFEILGFIDSYRELGPTRLGFDVLGHIEDLPRLSERESDLSICIAIGDNTTRAKIAAQVRRLTPNVPFANVIHPSCQVGRLAALGEGNVLLAGSLIGPSVTIGSFCLVGANASIDHDGNLGNFASLGPAATLGGNVHVGEYSAVCLGAKVIHGLCIGDCSVIGAGSLVVKDVGRGVVAYGQPARVIRRREQGEAYL